MHIDKNKANNYYKNLEWVTIRENNIHAQGKAIYQIDIETNKTIRTFKCLSDAAKFLKIKYFSDLVRCCKGKQKTAYGYAWKYVNNNLLENMENKLLHIHKLKLDNSENSIILSNEYKYLSTFRFNLIH